MRKESGLETLLKVDFKRLKSMYDVLPFERQKEFLKTFIEKVVIDPEWFEIHYVLPSGLGVEHLLFERGGDNDGKGRKAGGSDISAGGNENGSILDGGWDGASGNGNSVSRNRGAGNVKKTVRLNAFSESCKILTCESGVSDKNPCQNSVSDFCGHDDNAPRLSAYRKSRKNAGAAATAPENAKSKDPQGIKRISDVVNQQPTAYHSSCEKSGEGGIFRIVSVNADIWR
ncbi:MAG TPA: hypothetical protein PLK80_10170 [bacterium]|nr:MAG: hypothetical protein BWY28_02453 [bacterium ADurb.Bin236]HPI77090.1 hypothetical protein [bacterium]